MFKEIPQNNSPKFSYNITDFKYQLRHFIVFFAPVIIAAMTQLQTEGAVDEKALIGIAISLLLDATDKYVKDHK